MKSKLIFDKATHTYYLDGVEIPSVTQVIPKPDFSFVNPDVLETARIEGNKMHGKIETYFEYQDTFDDPDLIDLDRLLKYNKELIGDFVCSEKMFSYDGKYPFAGTPDTVFTKAIIDFKRTPPDKSMAALQFTGYNKLCLFNQMEYTENWLLCYQTKTGWRFKNVFNGFSGKIFEKCLEKYYHEKEINLYLNNKGKNYV